MRHGIKLGDPAEKRRDWDGSSSCFHTLKHSPSVSSSSSSSWLSSHLSPQHSKLLQLICSRASWRRPHFSAFSRGVVNSQLSLSLPLCSNSNVYSCAQYPILSRCISFLLKMGVIHSAPPPPPSMSPAPACNHRCDQWPPHSVLEFSVGWQ